MRLSELIGHSVVGESGARLGRVHDVLLIQDGRAPAGRDATFRVHALAVGRASIGTRLGYAQGHVEHPKWLGRLFGRGVVLVPWAAVTARGDDGEIVVDDSRVETMDTR